MHSRPTQDLTDACSELGIPCDVIGSARKADMGIEATGRGLRRRHEGLIANVKHR